jgi:glycosyltransferase involved in cell wall biosynthesis
VVVTTIPVATSALVATALAARFGAGLVLDYRDPWNGEAPPDDWPAWRVRLETRLEAWCLRRASATIATTPGIAASLRARSGRDVHVVPNCCEPERFDGVEPRRFERPTLVYAGGLYGDRTLEPVLAALARLRDAGHLGPRDLGLHYMGRTPEVAERSAADAGVSEFLSVEGVRPTREALAATLGAAANLSIVGDSHARQVPAKLFEHMAAGRRMLVIAPDPSDARDVVARVPSARCVTRDDGPGLEAALLEIAGAGAAGANAEIPDAFTLETTMAALDRVLRGAAARPAAG